MTDDVERVRRNLPSLERYVRMKARNTASLEQKSGELRGANPWHGSTTGNNFALDPDEEQWFCHSQGHKAGGGIFEYIAVDEGLVDCGHTDDISTVFTEVLEIAAEKAGVDLQMDAQDKAEVKKRRKEREMVEKVHEEAAAFYHEQLDTKLPHPEDGDPITVREWMREFYGLTDETLDEAMVGFSPVNPTGLLDAVSAGQKEVLGSGLAIHTADGVVDFFDGRITFPYFKHGKPRYFIGRKTPRTPNRDWENGKYKKLPTPDNKDSVAGVVDEPIFGLDHARTADTVIVTEGVTDVLAARQYGHTAIAPVTTTFKEDRMRDVAKLVRDSHVAVIMDEDAETDAGIQGALKTAKAIEKRTGPATEVQVARLPLDDGDLCDYLQQNGGFPGDSQ